MHKIDKFVGIALLFPLFTSAQATPPAGAPAQIIVTVGHLYGQEPPFLTRDDLIVTEVIDPLPITALVPLRGDRAALELFLLIDHCSDCEPGTKIDELRRFILAQPATTAVGVAYIDEGRLRIVENPTDDHERAVKALSAPAGSKHSNPFGALTELIQGWRQASPRRAVLMISNGVDAASDVGPDPAAEAAIAAAQRDGVNVYAIYHPSADYLSGDFTKLYAGQIQLAHVSMETGGEAYYWNFGPLPSLAPYLSDLATHLANQYLLEFLATPGAGAGALQDVTIKSKIPNVDLIVPYKTWVPGRGSGTKTSRGK